jgi:RNA polymerase sigma factor (TIGR02999 family)
MAERTDVTQWLNQLADGGGAGVDRLLPLIYDELRRLAESRLRQERPDHTLQATALVHEAYLKLVDQTNVTWQNRSHFVAVAGQAIRRILVDHARSRGRLKRGRGGRGLSLDDVLTLAADAPGADLLALDEALQKLARAHPKKARVVEMRFFAGMTVDEVSSVLGVASRTVERYWEFARAWLYRELEGAQDATGSE